LFTPATQARPKIEGTPQDHRTIRRSSRTRIQISADVLRLTPRRSLRSRTSIGPFSFCLRRSRTVANIGPFVYLPFEWIEQARSGDTRRSSSLHKNEQRSRPTTPSRFATPTINNMEMKALCQLLIAMLLLVASSGSASEPLHVSEREGWFKTRSHLYCIFSQSLSLLAGCRRREHRDGCPCIELRRGRRRFSQSSRGRLG